ncbi:hypothetical protein RB195_012579 [Necator americanus]|uniref:Uncharacterized protein n=1 Tax=Necator americanus TaxID=51031 RepID=A0ABR1DRJ5_NECAM
MVANSSKKEEKSSLSKRSGGNVLFKSKSNVKESERIARMKAAREMYSKLSKERSLKHPDVSSKPGAKKHPETIGNNDKENEPLSTENTSSPSRAFVFKPMASSMDMIRNNRIRVPNTRRASSIAGGRLLGPRPSLLPLGINVFDTNVSITDKQKVRDFVAGRLNTGTTPKKTASCSFDFDPQSEQLSARGSRSVRFRVEATITEQRESGSDEMLRADLQHESIPCQPRTDQSIPVPQSILKSKNKRPIFRKPSPPVTPISASPATNRRGSLRKRSGPVTDPHSTRFQLSFASTTSDESSSVPVVSEARATGEQQENNFSKAYTALFNMKYEQWKEVEPIMLDELIEMLEDTRQRIQNDAALMPCDSSLSLISLPDEVVPHKTQKKGFRRVTPRGNPPSTDLQANQEVMLINESAQRLGIASPARSVRSSQRLRLKDPVSSALGGDSPFYPISSPFF